MGLGKDFCLLTVAPVDESEELSIIGVLISQPKLVSAFTNPFNLPEVCSFGARNSLSWCLREGINACSLSGLLSAVEPRIGIMNSKAKRLATLVRELRDSQSQGQFAKKLGVSRSTVTLWESGLAWPEAENLQKLAILKGWNLEEIQTYLIEGELPEREPLEEMLDRVRSLPSEALAQVAAVAVQTLAARTGSTV